MMTNIQEILFLLESLGPVKLLENARGVGRAKTAVRDYVLVNCYWALDSIGFFSGNNPRNTKEINQEILDQIFIYLERLGHVRREKRCVQLTRLGQQFWNQVRGVFHIFSAYEPFLTRLSELLKKEILPKELKRVEENVAMGFEETGARFTFPIMGYLIRKHRLAGKGVIELGCANAGLTSLIAPREPRLKFLGVDYDAKVLDRAKRTVAELHLNGRARFLKKDIFDLDSKDFDFSHYDLVTATDLFHGYYFEGRKRLLLLLKRLKKALAGKRFLISEMCLPDEKQMAGLSYPQPEHELFHSLTAQKTFGPGELESILEESGWKIRNVWNARNAAARIFVRGDL